MSKQINNSIIKEFPERMWSKDCPVMLRKAKLVYLQEQAKNAFSFVFRNIDRKKSIEEIKIEVIIEDENGTELEQKLTYTYKNLNASFHELFGEGEYLALDSARAAQFILTVTEVKYENGEVWRGKHTPMTAMYKAEELKLSEENARLYQEAVLNKNQDTKVVNAPTQYDGYWYCTCSAVNFGETHKCWNCGNHKKYIFSYLRERKLKSFVRKKHRGKLVIGGSIAVIVICFMILLLPNAFQYKKAAEAASHGDFEKAAVLYEELGSYKDSVTQLQIVYYNYALQLAKEGSYEKALGLLDKIGEGKDIDTLRMSCYYELALKNYKAGNYQMAIDLLETQHDYRKGKELLEKCYQELEKK